MNFDDKNEIKFKVVLMGNSAVGKTALLTKYIDNKFDEKITTTIGTDMKNSNEEIDGKIFKLLIWDTAGQEIYKSVTKNFYKNAYGILLVYSVTDRESFLNIQNWIKEIDENKNYELIVFLIGNKTDKDFDRVVSYEEGLNLAKKYNYYFFETSAKEIKNFETQIEIREIFIKLIKEIYKKINFNANNVTDREIFMTFKNEEDKKSCSC